MARPSPEQRKKIEANKAKNAAIKARMDADDNRTKQRVERIISDALEHSKTAAAARLELPDMIELMQKLERSYMLAMATGQPGHATATVMSMARLRGFLIDQQITLQASPSDFDVRGTNEEVRQRLIERLASRHGGLNKAQRLLGKIEQIMKEDAADDGIIEGEKNDDAR